jgi:tRNA pseudouridine55 synthase
MFALNKQCGMSSAKALDRLKVALAKSAHPNRDKNNRNKRLRVGHGGTLDPLATGVLPVGIGRDACRQLTQLLHGSKTYVAEAHFGVSTDSLDIMGTIDAPFCDRWRTSMCAESMQAIADAQFVGAIEQLPPIYSAVKVGGKRLYELAHRGVRDVPGRKVRNVLVHEFRVERVEPPFAVLTIRCGGGTYVRSLVADLARAMGTCATLASLERTEHGPLSLDDCLSIDDIVRQAHARNLL